MGAFRPRWLVGATLLAVVVGIWLAVALFNAMAAG